MQDERASNVAGGDSGAGEETSGGVRSDRQRDLAAKSLRARESVPAKDDDDQGAAEGGDVDRRP
ncbi:MAG TPA: hypothetical protein VFR81_07550 [Longimicrobium sp.]|nr:hypothetical protein [Longimicrobium sp.]